MWWKMINILTLLPWSGIFIISANKGKTLEMPHAVLPLFFVYVLLIVDSFLSLWQLLPEETAVALQWFYELLRKDHSTCKIKATKPKEKVPLFSAGQNYCLYQGIWYKGKINCKTQLRSVLNLSETRMSVQMFNKIVFYFIAWALHMNCDAICL